MSKMIEIPDAVYSALERQAQATGKTYVELIQEGLRQSSQNPPSEAAERPVRERVHPQFYHLLEQIAEVRGVHADALALEWLMNPPRSSVQHYSAEETQARLQRFRERYAGTYDSGDAASANNDKIDADLARAYAE